MNIEINSTYENIYAFIRDFENNNECTIDNIEISENTEKGCDITIYATLDKLLKPIITMLQIKYMTKDKIKITGIYF